MALKCCPDCNKNIPKELNVARDLKCSVCSPKGSRLKVIECVTKPNKNVNVAKEMTNWIFAKEHVGFVAVAHNASG